MTAIAIDAKQFREACEWAEKLAGIDPNDKTALSIARIAGQNVLILLAAVRRRVSAILQGTSRINAGETQSRRAAIRTR
jgi:hypothetical protein